MSAPEEKNESTRERVRVLRVFNKERQNGTNGGAGGIYDSIFKCQNENPLRQLRRSLPFLLGTQYYFSSTAYLLFCILLIHYLFQKGVYSRVCPERNSRIFQ